MSSKAKIIPFYFPQFHKIPVNDLSWGEGYTDWDRVKTAKPLTNGHYQPRVPLNKTYYDLSTLEDVEWQINLALEHNVYGFSFYHYWFDGKLLLERPIELFRSCNHSLNYCITWANETWTKRWIGKGSTIIQEQKHTVNKNTWKAHYDYLRIHFLDDRYIKVLNKPMFIVYRPEIISDLKGLMDYFNELAIRDGFDGLHFVAVKAFDTLKTGLFRLFDAQIKFQPRELFSTEYSKQNKIVKFAEKILRSLPENAQRPFAEYKFRNESFSTFDYDEFWNLLLKNAKKYDSNLDILTYESALVDWDNTARYGAKAKFFKGANPQKFESYLKSLVDIVDSQNRDYVFVNAWNEWSEGAYLEPDERYEFDYLKAIKGL
jgi:hypothetical protein